LDATIYRLLGRKRAEIKNGLKTKEFVFFLNSEGIPTGMPGIDALP
jgi:hypothetical protein